MFCSSWNYQSSADYKAKPSGYYLSYPHTTVTPNLQAHLTEDRQMIGSKRKRPMPYGVQKVFILMVSMSKS